MSIAINNVSKRFGNFVALDNIKLEVASGELLALLGPSGCGKTTLLRVIAGLDQPDAGSIFLNGQDSTTVSVRQKRVGFVFQHYALFPHMSIFENVAFGLRVRQSSERPSREEIRDRVTELLSMVQMEWSAERLPAQLSGGQRQRIALARALAVKPGVLLLDEPFSALDAKVRLELRRWLRKLHDELHITSVFVTHDQEEALELADRVVIINKGRVEQQGTPAEVYDNPANAFVYNFLGNVNVFHGRVEQGRFPLGVVPLAIPHNQADLEDRDTQAFIRPHDIEVSASSDGEDYIEATIQMLRMRGGVVSLELARKNGEGTIEAEISRDRLKELGLSPGSTVFIRFRQVRFFGPDDYVI